MDPLSVLGTVVGLIGAVGKVANTVTLLKERWQYASLNISTLSSSLWLVKAALEEISDWRSKAKDHSERSEQLDTNLEVCVQSCAVLIAVVERKLKDIDLENVTKYDKVRFMNLDNIFKDFSSHLADQVRVLQLLLTIYQCRSLSEQNEKLQRTHTRRVVSRVQQNAASLSYEDQDVEDAASILSEAPTTNFSFDEILMQHRNYSRTYPRLYAQMQDRFPSKRDSIASTVYIDAQRRVAPPIDDPILSHNISLPFLGVPFAGETLPEEPKEELQQNEVVRKAGAVKASPVIKQRNNESSKPRSVRKSSKRRTRASFNSLYDNSDDERSQSSSTTSAREQDSFVDMQLRGKTIDEIGAEIKDEKAARTDRALGQGGSSDVEAKLEPELHSIPADAISDSKQSSGKVAEESPLPIMTVKKEGQPEDHQLPTLRSSDSKLSIPTVVAEHPSNDQEEDRIVTSFLDFNFGPDINLEITPRTTSTVFETTKQDNSMVNAEEEDNIEALDEGTQVPACNIDTEFSTRTPILESQSTVLKNLSARSQHEDEEVAIEEPEDPPSHEQDHSLKSDLKQPETHETSDDDTPASASTIRPTHVISKQEDVRNTAIDMPLLSTVPAPIRSPPPLPTRRVSEAKDEEPSNEVKVVGGLEADATSLQPLSLPEAVGRSSLQSDHSSHEQKPPSTASSHSYYAPSNITSKESIARTQTTYQTPASSIMTVPAIQRVITDPVKHNQKGLAIKNSLLTHRISSVFSSRSSSERLGKLQNIVQAINQGNAILVSELMSSLDKVSDINTSFMITDKIARTCLMHAASLDQIDCVQVIVTTYPPSILAVDKEGKSAIHHALEHDALTTAAWLVTQVDQTIPPKYFIKFIDIKIGPGLALMHLSARASNSIVMQALIKAEANVTVRDDDGRTALFHALEVNNADNVEFLLRHGFDPNSRNGNDETALMVAARQNDQASFMLLTTSGANKSLRDKNGDLAIHYAARHGHINILEALFQSIDDVTAKNKLGEQPIHLAAAGNHAGILKVLLHLPGIQVNTWTQPPYKQPAVIRSEGLWATAKLASTPLHYACSAGHYEAADILLTRGALVNVNQEDGYSPLMMACQAQSAPLCSLLLLHGADPNTASADEGMTALHIACKVDDPQSARMLLQYGANVQAKLNNRTKDTPSGLALRENLGSARNAANVALKYRMQIIKATSEGARNTNPIDVRAITNVGRLDASTTPAPYPTPRGVSSYGGPYAGPSDAPPPYGA